MPQHLPRASRAALRISLPLFILCAPVARAGDVTSNASATTTPARFDDGLMRQRLDQLRQRLGSLRQMNPFAQPANPGIVIPPPQPRRFFMRKVPLPPQDRSNWIRKEFNGQTVYLVPCQQMQPMMASTTRPSQG